MARTTLQDVARTAGVSLATVDRVLNRRPGVHCRNRRARPAARSTNSSIGPTVSPRGSPAAASTVSSSSCRPATTPSCRRSTSEVRATAEYVARRAGPDRRDPCRRLRRRHAGAALDRLQGEVDGVAVVALDHPSVREAIDDLTAPASRW